MYWTSLVAVMGLAAGLAQQADGSLRFTRLVSTSLVQHAVRNLQLRTTKNVFRVTNKTEQHAISVFVLAVENCKPL
jgi:hypothetical protein